jgi:hypothetical protein
LSRSYKSSEKFRRRTGKAALIKLVERQFRSYWARDIMSSPRSSQDGDDRSAGKSD